jgi:hypothetical protein
MKSLLIAVLLVSAILFQIQNMWLLGRDGENTPDECETLNGLYSVRNGRALYHDATVPPYTQTPHPPLMYVVPGIIARLVETDMLHTFIIGRTYVYLSWLLVGVMVFGLARSFGSGKSEAIIGAMLWWSSGLAVENAIAFRPDAGAITLSLAGLWLYWRGGKASAAVVMAMAFLQRHSAVAAITVVVLEELNQRRFRMAAVLAGTWVVVVGAVVLSMQWLTAGAFVKCVFGIVAIGAGWPRVELLLEMAALRGFAAFAAGIAALLLKQGGGARVIRRYFLVATAVAFATSWKFGSGLNYYLEPFAASCVLAALLVNDPRAWLRLGWLTAAIIAALPALAGRIRKAPRVATTECVVEGLALSEDGYFALRRDGEPYLLNASLLSALRDAGRFDDSDIVRKIQDSAFATIVTTAPVEQTAGFRQFPPNWLTAIDARYRLDRMCGMLYVYLPRSRPAK